MNTLVNIPLADMARAYATFHGASIGEGIRHFATIAGYNDQHARAGEEGFTVVEWAEMAVKFKAAPDEYHQLG